MTRIRSVPSTYTTNGESYGTTLEVFSDELSPRDPVSGFYTEFNPCEHVKCIKRFNGTYRASSWSYKGYCNAYQARDDLRSFLPQIMSQGHYSLDFQENNSFELITFLADIDGLVATFTKKFWKEISYGAVNWGILPLISDIKSLLSSLGDLYTGVNATFAKMDKRTTRRCPVKIIIDRGFYYTHLVGVTTYNGYFTNLGAQPDPSEMMAILLDELGLHPDLKTVWDIVPFSFVADYFLPIGDVLESCHPRGWYAPQIRFDGTYSFKGILTDEGDLRGYNVPDTHSYECYIRGKYTQNLPTRRPLSVEWASPSPKELFNTAYLARASRRS